eukprot:TRINITY_DN5557_c0_g2_i1.p1 TRINITY_DN5557_c0_g2~~TRINITY_DN5557_c0_g2_i1.p1  ORF type:complete len:107 (-),score=16.00 TRINITY_DN5557_c0_g2_i1:13-333(-)
MNRTEEEKVTTITIMYADHIIGSFDKIQVLPPTCHSLTASQNINDNSLSVLFDYENTCEPLSLEGGVIAAIVVSGFIVLVILVIVILMGVPSLKRKIFPFAFGESN